MSEMSYLFRARTAKKDPVLIPQNADAWGSSYFVDSKNAKYRNSEQGLFKELGEGKEFYKNYFVAEVDKIARYAIPFVKTIYYLMGNIKE
jgi:hypothetical protein